MKYMLITNEPYRDFDTSGGNMYIHVSLFLM